ncbi:hypothetical protein ALC57_16020 [Trachymyrmex cornetzi]|uniref:Uncharacterized protein n=1 Tax=Trachymyrmex cornetzi TaxID=471704 RepID=A0A195DG60_9HYME|nr:hypothetical protein ALC57_16020 [Trachymyrmex cornetzi]
MPDKKERRGEKKRSHPPLAPAFLFPDFFSRGWKEEKRRVGQVAGMAEVGKRDERESRGNSNYASLAAKATDVRLFLPFSVSLALFLPRCSFTTSEHSTDLQSEISEYQWLNDGKAPTLFYDASLFAQQR